MVERAASIYLGFVTGGVVVAAGLGLLPAEVFWPHSGWGVAVGLLLTAPAAVIPYLLELALVSAKNSDSQPTLATALFMREAEPTVTALLRTPTQWWIVALGTAVTEELLFRGALLHAILTDVGPLQALLASALVFGMHHVAFGVRAIIGKVVAGLLWGWLVLISGTVVVSLIAHLVFQYLVWRRYQKVEGWAASC
ncbi:MAG: CPBP family intramembrane metalloprotease [Propionibacteriaceae bacterium]|nr:CPBP family intramembrane metalloprotease [Propionibacteriaceae bacterium]